jgi:hypothetical protein
MSTKDTLRDWILTEADGEAIEAVVMGWGDYNSEAIPDYADCPRGKVLTWDEALPWLEYEFDSGYGAPSCQAIYAYTKTWVIAISQYDGSTAPFRIPRNPTEGVMPRMPGG